VALDALDAVPAEGDAAALAVQSSSTSSTFAVLHMVQAYKRCTEQNRTEQNRTEQNRTEQNRTEQNRTEQNRAEQNRTEQNRTEQNRTEQSRAEQNRTECVCMHASKRENGRHCGSAQNDTTPRRNKRNKHKEH
jgi:hypothetical protein